MQSRLVWGLVVVFAAIAATQILLGVRYSPVLLLVAVPFATAAFLLWYHVSGRMAKNVRRRARRRSTREDARARARVEGDATGVGSGAGGRGAPTEPEAMSASAAYDALGLDDGASADEVQRAYRERVKETHPDRQDGNEEEFKRVTAAYRRLQSD